MFDVSFHLTFTYSKEKQNYKTIYSPNNLFPMDFHTSTRVFNHPLKSFLVWEDDISFCNFCFFFRISQCLVKWNIKHWKSSNEIKWTRFNFMDYSKMRKINGKAIKDIETSAHKPLSQTIHWNLADINFETLIVTCQNFMWIGLKTAELYVNESPVG